MAKKTTFNHKKMHGIEHHTDVWKAGKKDFSWKKLFALFFTLCAIGFIIWIGKIAAGRVQNFVGNISGETIKAISQSI